MKGNSSVDEPAILKASTLITYLVADDNPVIRNLRCGFKAFDTAKNINIKKLIVL